MRMEREKVGRAVEAAIADYGGELVKGVVVWNLKNRFNLEPADAVERPEEFIVALREIYGPFEEAVERRICERIAAELGVEYAGQGLLKLAEQIRPAGKQI